MKHKIKTWLLPVLTACLTLTAALFWVALRVNYSGISKFLGADTNPSFLVMNLPIFVCVLAWVGGAFGLLGLWAWPRRKWPTIAGLVIGLVVTAGAVVVVLFGAKDYLPFISVHFWKSMAVAGGILLFALVLLFPVPNRRKGIVPLKLGLLALVTLGAVVLGYGLRPCEFTYGAVVYGVEEDYQIVFSTSDSAIAWVEIGEERYYDLYAGSMRSADKVHKIQVPQAVLDAAGGYSIHAQQMIYRGPFGGYLGKELQEEYPFRAVDSSDGLYYYAVSDVHEAADAAIRSAGYEFGQEMDFLVMLGDIVSMVETERDAQLANYIAHGITGGQIPVLYARGNHEIKGEYAEVLYKYVGSRNQSFAYPVMLGQKDVFAVVLDLGEDHEDDWWEYYGTAQFDIYRQEQTRMLEELLEEGTYADYRYQLALCHIPITYVEEDGLFQSFRQEWTALLNEMGMDMCVGGHLHQLWPMLPGAVEPGSSLVYRFDYIGDSGKRPGGSLTDHQFPAILAGRRSLDQTGSTQKNGFTDYMGLATRVDLEAGIQWSSYVNSNRQIVTGYYPFEGDYPGNTFQDIKTELNPAQ